MIADIEREGRDEIVESKDARKAIGKRTAKMFKNRLKNGCVSMAGGPRMV